MFDISKSKLYAQIMTACASFFGLGEDATEAEIHEAVEGKDPLTAQLESARTEAIAAQAAQLADLQSQFETMKTDLATLRTDVEAKDARIAELQVEAASHSDAIKATQTQHKQEVATLAGQIAALKAGKEITEDEGGDPHEAGKVIVTPKGQTAISNASLQALIKRGRQN